MTRQQFLDGALEAAAKFPRDEAKVLVEALLDAHLEHVRRGGRPKGAPVPYSDAFLRVWEEYPRKDGKHNAFIAWQGAGSPTIEQMSPGWRADCENYARREAQYIPFLATYMNQRRWEDVRYFPAGQRPVKQAAAALRAYTKDFAKNLPR